MAGDMRRDSEVIETFAPGDRVRLSAEGRRALWLWIMSGDAPLGFLHHFYYQTLEQMQR
jgi:hypothetical protein